MKHLMKDAYKTEIDLVPVVLDMEMTGIPLSPLLPKMHANWTLEFQAGEDKLRELTGEKPGTKAMFNKLIEIGKIDKSKIQYTDKGNPRYGREFISGYVDDLELRQILTYRSKLQKILGTYLNPWLKTYNEHGRMYPFFQSTRGDNDYGTRTGRFSSNFQQIPHVDDDSAMPNLRTCVVPEEGHVILKRDYAAQEIRVTAHYAEGGIMMAFQKDPDMDVHNFVQSMIKEKLGLELPRRICKNISFLKLYGGGPKKLVESAGCSLEEAYKFFKAYDAALPEFKMLSISVEALVRSGKKMRTWGGRLYDVEKPSHGRELYYKLLNVLIQGSSADMSKQAMLRYWYHPDRKGRILLVVHDEIVLTCPEKHATHDMRILKWAMEDQPGWDVKMLTDGKIGENFGELQDFVV